VRVYRTDCRFARTSRRLCRSWQGREPEPQVALENPGPWRDTDGHRIPELLVEEYQLAATALGSGAKARTVIRQKRLRDVLLEKRDRYIADRNQRNLGEGETGVLFMFAP